MWPVVVLSVWKISGMAPARLVWPGLPDDIITSLPHISPSQAAWRVRCHLHLTRHTNLFLEFGGTFCFIFLWSNSMKRGLILETANKLSIDPVEFWLSPMKFCSKLVPRQNDVTGSAQSSLWLLIQKMKTRSVNPSFSKQRRAEEIRNLRTLLLSVKKVGVCRWLNMSYPFILEVKNKTIITSSITFNWLK